MSHVYLPLIAVQAQNLAPALCVAQESQFIPKEDNKQETLCQNHHKSTL